MEVEESQPAEEGQQDPDAAGSSGVLNKRKLVAGNVTEMVEVPPKKPKLDSQYPIDSVPTSHTVGGPSDVVYCPSPNGRGSRPTSTHSSRDGFSNPQGQTPSRDLNISQDPVHGWSFGFGNLGPVFPRGGRTPAGSPLRPQPTLARSPAAGGRADVLIGGHPDLSNISSADGAGAAATQGYQLVPAANTLTAQHMGNVFDVRGQPGVVMPQASLAGTSAAAPAAVSAPADHPLLVNLRPDAHQVRIRYPNFLASTWPERTPQGIFTCCYAWDSKNEAVCVCSVPGWQYDWAPADLEALLPPGFYVAFGTWCDLTASATVTSPGFMEVPYYGYKHFHTRRN